MIEEYFNDFIVFLNVLAANGKMLLVTFKSEGYTFSKCLCWPTTWSKFTF